MQRHSPHHIHVKYRAISDFSTHLSCKEIFHVEKSEISPHDRIFLHRYDLTKIRHAQTNLQPSAMSDISLIACTVQNRLKQVRLDITKPNLTRLLLTGMDEGSDLRRHLQFFRGKTRVGPFLTQICVCCIVLQLYRLIFWGNFFLA